MKKLNFVWLLSLLLIPGCDKEDVRPTEQQSPVLELRNGNGVQVTKPFRTVFAVPLTALANGQFVGFCDDQFGNFNIVNIPEGRVDETVTHLGKIFVTWSEVCVRPYLQDDPEVFPPAVYGPFLDAIELFPIPGVITQKDDIVAANGKDQLFITSNFNSYPDPDDKFRSILEGTFEITGGTGRFAGASGGGTMKGSTSADFINPIYPYVREYDGEITY